MLDHVIRLQKLYWVTVDPSGERLDRTNGNQAVDGRDTDTNDLPPVRLGSTSPSA